VFQQKTWDECWNENWNIKVQSRTGNECSNKNQEWVFKIEILMECSNEKWVWYDTAWGMTIINWWQSLDLWLWLFLTWDALQNFLDTLFELSSYVGCQSPLLINLNWKIHKVCCIKGNEYILYWTIQLVILLRENNIFIRTKWIYYFILGWVFISPTNKVIVTWPLFQLHWVEKDSI
jgi:hypothetical protein